MALLGNLIKYAIARGARGVNCCAPAALEGRHSASLGQVGSELAKQHQPRLPIKNMASWQPNWQMPEHLNAHANTQMFISRKTLLIKKFVTTTGGATAIATVKVKVKVKAKATW